MPILYSIVLGLWLKSPSINIILTILTLTPVFCPGSDFFKSYIFFFIQQVLFRCQTWLDHFWKKVYELIRTCLIYVHRDFVCGSFHLGYLASRTAIVWGTAACRWDLGQPLQTVVKKLSFLDSPPCATASNPSQHYPQPARCSSVWVWVSESVCVCVGNKSTAPTLHCHSCRAASPSSRPGTHTLYFACDLPWLIWTRGCPSWKGGNTLILLC